MLPVPRTSTPHVTPCSAHTLLMLAGLPVHRSADNLCSVWGHGVRNGCGGCILVDATHPPGCQQGRDQGSRGGTASVQCGATRLTAEEMQTDALWVLSEPSNSKQIPYLHGQEFNPSFRLVFLFPFRLSQRRSLLGAGLGR